MHVHIFEIFKLKTMHLNLHIVEAMRALGAGIIGNIKR